MFTLRLRVQLQLLNQSFLVSTPTAYHSPICSASCLRPQASCTPVICSGWPLVAFIFTASLTSLYLNSSWLQSCLRPAVVPILDLGRLICSIIVIANLKSWRIFPTLHLWFPMRHKTPNASKHHHHHHLQPRCTFPCAVTRAERALLTASRSIRCRSASPFCSITVLRSEFRLWEKGSQELEFWTTTSLQDSFKKA